MADPITQEQIKGFVAAWYLALDQHAPIETCYAMLADRDLNVQFPDGDIHDMASFKTWYDRVTNLFFDENHNVVSVEGEVRGDEAEVIVVVGWQASWWEPRRPSRARLDGCDPAVDRPPVGQEPAWARDPVVLQRHPQAVPVRVARL